MSLLPIEAYHDEKHVKALQDTLGGQVKALQEARDSLKAQYRPSTASGWGMAKHERAWGILVDEGAPPEQRLAAYRAKRRGVGTTTKDAVANIVRSYADGSVEVVEHKKEYWFEVVVEAPVGHDIPRAGIEHAVREVIPAHMEPMFSFSWQAGTEQPCMGYAAVAIAGIEASITVEVANYGMG
jgi:hypothetical protein